RLNERVRQFQQLGWRDRIKLVMALLKGKMRWLLEVPIKFVTLKKNMAEGAIRRFLRIPFSLELLQWRRNRVIREFSRVHKLQKYPGRITVFYCSESPVGGLKLWTQFAADVEAFEIGGNHLTMVEEPYASQLAEALNTSLRKAQRAV